jgi:hypothetical protein
MSNLKLSVLFPLERKETRRERQPPKTHTREEGAGRWRVVAPKSFRVEAESLAADRMRLDPATWALRVNVDRELDSRASLAP